MGFSKSVFGVFPVPAMLKPPPVSPCTKLPPQCLAAAVAHPASSPIHASTWAESLSGECKVGSLPQGPPLVSLSPLILFPQPAGSSRSTERLSNFSCVHVPIPASSKLKNLYHIAFSTYFSAQWLHLLPVDLTMQDLSIRGHRYHGVVST